MTKPRMVLFDVYETLLDMQEMEKKVNQLIGNRRAYPFWFELLSQYCFVDNCINQFNPFLSIARVTLKMTGQTFGTAPTDSEIDNALDLLAHLPIHAGVQEGLSRLNDLNIRIAALTNTPSETVCDRMRRTGLISYFENVLSAETVKKYKPSAEVYFWAAKRFELPPEEILLASAHDWDLMGAGNVGMKTAYVGKRKLNRYPLAPTPDISCKNVLELAEHFSE